MSPGCHLQTVGLGSIYDAIVCVSRLVVLFYFMTITTTTTTTILQHQLVVFSACPLLPDHYGIPPKIYHEEI